MAARAAGRQTFAALSNALLSQSSKEKALQEMTNRWAAWADTCQSWKLEDCAFADWQAKGESCPAPLAFRQALNGIFRGSARI
eukprot:scaffold1399_cov410-Prasinococcus_capsulatus_cf.AAC.45